MKYQKTLLGLYIMHRNFRTLDLAIKFYHQTLELELKGHIRDQFHRAALSISLNLAEGTGKPTKKDRVRFFYISFGSLRECQAIIKILRRENDEIGLTSDHLGASIYRLIKNAV